MAEARGPARRAAVFYNPAMRFDRDLAVAFARAWAARVGSPVVGWEMMGATGVRGLRLLHESALLRKLFVSDLHPRVAPVLEANVLRYASEGAHALSHDARIPLQRRGFGYVDLDPYGTPVPFLASAVECVQDGGILAVTATDLRVLAGVDRGVAERRYGGRPVRGRLGPEAGLRLLIAAIARTARTVGWRIHPVLSYVHDHHVRCYVQLRADGSGSADTDPVDTITETRWKGPPLPRGGPYGPMWLGALQDPSVVERLLPNDPRAGPETLEGFIGRLTEECRVDIPFYYEPNTLARRLGLRAPPSLLRFRSALGAQGFSFARTHARPGGFRTDATDSTVVSIARELDGATDHSQKARVRA